MTIGNSRSRPASFVARTAVLILAGAVGAQAQLIPEPLSPPPADKDGISTNLVEAGALVNAAEARSVYNVTGSGLTVAVLDTGIYKNHSDFGVNGNRILAIRNFTNANGGNPSVVTDGNGHGTHVSGVIAANGKHTGIAPGAGIVALKVLKQTNEGLSESAAAALDWVIANHATYKIRVVCMALGDRQNHTGLGAAPAIALLQPRIQTLLDLKIPVVASSGNLYGEFNGQPGMQAPGIIPETLSVGAVYDQDIGGFSYGNTVANTTGIDRICPFSQRLVKSGFGTDLFAPGAPVTATGIGGPTASATRHGTSQAAGVLSGALLLMQERFYNLNGYYPTVSQLISALKTPAVPVEDGDDEDDNVAHRNETFGRLDLMSSIAALTQTTLRRRRITGRVARGRTGVRRVVMTATSSSSRVRVRTSSSGRFTLLLPKTRTYTLRPTLSGYRFSPRSRRIVRGSRNRFNQNFRATASLRPSAPDASEVRTTSTFRQYLLVWNDRANNEQGFRLESSTDGVTYTQFMTRPANSEDALVLIGSARRWYFRIVAYNERGAAAAVGFPVINVRR